MTKIEMKSKGAALRSSEKKHRRLFSAAVVLLICCLAFVGVAGADVPNDLPTAEVTILNDQQKETGNVDDLNIAMLFTDKGTDEQCQEYGGGLLISYLPQTGQ